MDHQFGAVRNSLERHGFAPRTLFIYASDQGAQWPFGKWNLYEAGIRTPLIAAWPGRIRPGTKSEALVSLIDLLPTFMEAASAEPPKEIDGRGFLSVLLESQERHRNVVFASHTGDGRMNRSPMRCVVTDR